MAQSKRRAVVAVVSFSVFAVGTSVVGTTPMASAKSNAEALWTSQYDGGNRSDSAMSLAVSPDGAKVFVTGSSDDGPSLNDYATLAYDAATGAQLWEARYNGPANSNDYAWRLALSPDGSRVFVTGGSSTGTRDDWATVAYDSGTGEEQWVAHYGTPAGYDDPIAIAVNPEGTMVYVTGYAGTSSFLTTVAYEAATGALAWDVRQKGSPGGLSVSPDGAAVYVSGTAYPPIGGAGFMVVAYDAASGVHLYDAAHRFADANAYGGPSTISSDGARLYVTGAVNPFTGGADFGTAAFDAATGADLWAATFGRPGGISYDYPSAIDVAPDGSSVYVAGTVTWTNHQGYDAAVLAYDTVGGSEVWTAAQQGAGGANSWTAIEVSPDGSRVYTTGYLSSEFGYGRFGISAFDAATGHLVWSDAMGPNVAWGNGQAVVVSPDGTSVYASGYLPVE
jgi:DNA-binding beta-propeller fold protein YncE